MWTGCSSRFPVLHHLASWDLMDQVGYADIVSTNRLAKSRSKAGAELASFTVVYDACLLYPAAIRALVVERPPPRRSLSRS